MLTILSSIVNMTGHLTNRDFNRHENLQFDNEADSHMSSENYQENGYGHDMGLLIILRSLRVSYFTRSGCREKSIQITHVYLRPGAAYRVLALLKKDMCLKEIGLHAQILLTILG